MVALTGIVAEVGDVPDDCGVSIVDCLLASRKQDAVLQSHPNMDDMYSYCAVEVDVLLVGAVVEANVPAFASRYSPRKQRAVDDCSKKKHQIPH